ncbi:DegT/DnrJ/EryC1/StrS family aminotransferase [Streptomyces clavifer]|uniref:DegT/DnrJ/EryC1/StrS family aminotransferase n=1 Tax=Streptomyces clavifer TaxID=68188 RepID=UPI0036A39CD0
MSPSRCAGLLWRAVAHRRTVVALTGRLRELTGHSHAVLTGSGRAALRLALESLGAGPGTEVVLSTFNCTAVADAVLATGARPVLVDFDLAGGPDFTSAQLRGRPVIFTNGLGLDEWARHAGPVREGGGLPVLDLAQAAPAPETLIRYAGVGCPVVLSFGEGKQLGGAGGGALLLSPEGEVPSSGPGGRATLRPLARELDRYALQLAPQGVRAAVERRARQSVGWSHTKASHLPNEAGEVKVAEPSRWESAAAAALLASASTVRAGALAHDAYVRTALDGQLSGAEFVPSTPDLIGGIELLFARRGERHRFAGALAAQGVPSTWNYYPLHRTGPYAEFASGPMPGADHVWPRVLSVPKRPQPRLTGKLLVDALLAADRALYGREAATHD